MASTRVLEPCGTTGAPARPVSAPFDTLAGRRIGVLDNGKPNALLLMTEVASRLAERTGAEVSKVITKRTAAEPCDPQLIKQLSCEAELVITGSADCGSCTSWSIHDVCELEAAGARAVGMTTEAFEALSRQVASSLGMPDSRIAVVAHPLGGIAEEAVRQHAADSVEEVLRLVTRQ